MSGSVPALNPPAGSQARRTRASITLEGEAKGVNRDPSGKLVLYVLCHVMSVGRGFIKIARDMMIYPRGPTRKSYGDLV